MPRSNNSGDRLVLWGFGFVCLCVAGVPTWVSMFAQQAAATAQVQHQAGRDREEPLPTKHASEESTGSRIEMNGETNVLKIRYRCPNRNSGNGELGTCAITVSKEEFGALVQALDPNMSADGRQSLAAEYSRLLIMAAEARRRGFDQLPEIQTLLKFSALQVFATKLVREISAQPPLISPSEVEQYFREHKRDYQEVLLSRILVSSKVKDTSHSGIPAAERAEAVRTRAIDGEDFAVLQREITGAPETAGSNVRMGPIPCQSLPEAHRQVCDLQSGEVSMVLADTLGYVIYRLESRRSWGLEEVRDQIRAILERQRVQEEIQSVRTPISLELDERYFGKLPKSNVAIEHGMHFPAAKTTVPSQATPPHHH